MPQCFLIHRLRYNMAKCFLQTQAWGRHTSVLPYLQATTQLNVSFNIGQGMTCLRASLFIGLGTTCMANVSFKHRVAQCFFYKLGDNMAKCFFFQRHGNNLAQCFIFRRIGLNVSICFFKHMLRDNMEQLLFFHKLGDNRAKCLFRGPDTTWQSASFFIGWVTCLLYSQAGGQHAPVPFSQSWGQQFEVLTLFIETGDNSAKCFISIGWDNIVKCLLFLQNPETTWQSVSFSQDRTTW